MEPPRYINVGGCADDTAYRYRMPRVAVAYSARSVSPAVTALTNVYDVCCALVRPPWYLVRFLSVELGVRCCFDEAARRALLETHVDADALQALVLRFVELFVLCARCRLPETALHVRSGLVAQACRACGCVGLVDQTHGCVPFMRRHPVRHEENALERDVRLSAARHLVFEREDAARGGRRSSRDDADDSDDSDGVVWTSDTSLEAQLRRQREFAAISRAVAENMQTLHADLVIDKLRACRARQRERASSSSNSSSSSSSSSSSGSSSSRDGAAEADADELHALCRSFNVPLREHAELLFAALFAVGQPFVRLLDEHALCRCFCRAPAERTQLLEALEEWVFTESGARDATLRERFARGLLALYDADVADEAALVAWHARPCESLDRLAAWHGARCAAQPIIDWLRCADEDDDEEEEEANEEEAAVVQLV